ncbi:hypothetical protein Tco_1497255 [Tanacetum coccineum]
MEQRTEVEGIQGLYRGLLSTLLSTLLALLSIWAASMKNDELVDYNNVVENDEVVKETEPRAEVESNAAIVLNGDHARQT